MVKTLGAKDQVSRKYKHCFSRQYLEENGIVMTRKDDRILGPVPHLYDIKLPNTKYNVGELFVKHAETKPLTSYEQLLDLGLVIISRRIKPFEKWDMGQQVIYELKYKNKVADHLGKFPTGKYGAIGEYDPFNKAVRLVGIRTGPLGYGPWVRTEEDKSKYYHDGGHELTYKGYGDDSDGKIDSQMREWLGMEQEAKPVYIKEAAFMITKSNEIVCFPNIPDMPSILVTGMKGCVTKDTLIDMPRDMRKYPLGVPISELIGKKDFYVYSYNIQKRRLELKKAQSCEFSKVDDVYEIELTNGMKIKATGDHPFMTVGDGRGNFWGVYKKLQDLNWSRSKKEKRRYYNRTLRQTLKTDRLFIFPRHVNFEQHDNSQRIRVDFSQKGIYELREQIPEHSFIVKQVYGKKRGLHIYYKNGDHLDKRVENLHVATPLEHMRQAHSRCYAHSFYPERVEAINKVPIRTVKMGAKPDARTISSTRYAKTSKVFSGIIKEIRYVGKEEVYDIVGVQDNGNYIANGFFVSNTGKSYCLHSLVSRFFWKPEFKFKIVILNDSSRETGTWCLPNEDPDQIMMLKKLNERPLPLPTVYLHPKVKDDYEKLYMGTVGFDVTIPFKEIVENHKDYLQIEGSQRYFNKIKDQLKNAESENIAEGILDLMGVGMGIPQNSANKIRAEFETLFDAKMTDISSKKQHPWSVSTSPGRRFNPLTACVHAGVLPVLETEYVSNQRSMLGVYFTYFVKDLFMRQKQDPDFQKQRSELLLIIDEAHNISQKGMHSGADMLLRRCVREGRPRRIGTLLATQKFSELPDIIKDNSTYLICFKNPGEAAAIANQYKMGKQAVEFITDLEKHECLAYTTEYYIVYDSRGRRRRSKPNEIFVGHSLPPYSMHKRPKTGETG
jgi:hypothetical protein